MAAAIIIKSATGDFHPVAALLGGMFIQTDYQQARNEAIIIVKFTLPIYFQADFYALSANRLRRWRMGFGICS